MWFEIWGHGSGLKKFDFPDEFREISMLSGNFTEIFQFLRQLKKLIFQAEIGHLQLLLGKLLYFLFLFKSHLFLTYFLYLIRYNNFSRPVHDSHNPQDSLPNIRGFATPNPPR